MDSGIVAVDSRSPFSKSIGSTWNLELGTWGLELGAWSLELGAWNLELGAGRQLNRDNFWLVRSFDNSRQEKVKNWKR